MREADGERVEGHYIFRGRVREGWGMRERRGRERWKGKGKDGNMEEGN